jgi:two-component system phosphate regulon sensor histidine kinase PhoR
VILNRNEAIEWCNAAAESLLGLSWPLVAGNALTSEIREPILEEYLTKADYTRSLEFVSPVNKAKVLSLLVTPIGRKKRKLVIARDVTQVYLLDQTRRDFVANVSHELRTPLTVIAGFLETFAEESANAPGWKRSVELMRQQTKSMERLISDLLTLSRLEMEDTALDPRPVPVPNLLAAIAEEVRAFTGTSGHVIQLDSESDLWLQGHAEELKSAFSNLVFNAVRHTPDRTEVQIRWYSDGVGAHLSVQDNGEGIPTRHLPRLTERFYRVDKSRSPGSGGTGLGLAIVKHILTRHGAELSIASTVGEGSTFACHFPPSVVIHHGEQEGPDPDQGDLHANAR